MVSAVTKRALVIFRDNSETKDVVSLLNSIGFSVDIASYGVEALKIMQRRRPYDLIVSELDLDEISGLVLLGCAKKNPATITIGVNNGNQTLRRVAAEFGIDPILELPFDIKKFSAVLIERLNE
jgi:CheY-like chemotaxis protein